MPVLTEKLGKDIEDIIHKCEDNEFLKDGTITILQQKKGNSTRLYIEGFKKADGTTKPMPDTLKSFIKVRNAELLSVLSELIQGLEDAGYSSVAPYDGRQGY